MQSENHARERDIRDIMRQSVFVVMAAIIASRAWGQGLTGQISGTVADLDSRAGLNVWDISLFRNFNAVDTGGRFDAAGNQVNARLGQYTSTLDARRMVLGVKIYF